MATKSSAMLPSPTPFALDDSLNTSLYIGAAGFEDRAVKLLKLMVEAGHTFDRVIAIEYLPYDERNKKSDFVSLFDQLSLAEEKIHWVTYNRPDPEGFMPQLSNLKRYISGVDRVIIDISGMSKFLIVVLLQELRNSRVNIEIAYAEAIVYHPTKEKYECEREKFDEPPEGVPVFLTGDILSVVTTRTLSSVVMQGYPAVMVVFPTFNHREMTSLFQEIMPQHLVVVEGMPHEEENRWRLDAIRWINKLTLTQISSFETHMVSTFNYGETLELLESVYLKFSDTHRIVVAPTGSKLQALAVFSFKQVRPDIQLVYPVTTRFSDEYSERTKAFWGLTFGRIRDFTARLDAYRWQDIIELQSQIEA